MEFKDKIKSTRQKLLMSQQKFAKELGIVFSTVNLWENDKTNYNLNVVEKLADFEEDAD
jgi:transcriptional regulator with XRE-family HTH domain